MTHSRDALRLLLDEVAREREGRSLDCGPRSYAELVGALLGGDAAHELEWARLRRRKRRRSLPAKLLCRNVNFTV